MVAANLIKPCNGKIIVSCNVAGGATLKEELGHLVTQMQPTGADIIKLVIDANDITDLAHLFHLLSRYQVCTINMPMELISQAIYYHH